MKIVVCGCNGRMGTVVVKTAQKHRNIKIIGGIDRSIESDYGFAVFDSIDKLPVNPDVIIDFSNPVALFSLLDYGVKNNVPLVLCTTGYSDDDINKINECSVKIPIFFSGNMSIGINLLISLSKKAAEVLGFDFDVEIVEKHHNKKIDAPSGTAFMIADNISESRGGSMQYIYNRHSEKRPRDKYEIGIHSVRGGNMAGDHDVIFAGKNEVITLSHHAQSRDIFAEGAIKAAEFIKNKPCGMYNMDDLTK